MNTVNIPTVTPVKDSIPTVQPVSAKTSTKAVFIAKDVENTFIRDMNKQHDKNWMDYKAKISK